MSDGFRLSEAKYQLICSFEIVLTLTGAPLSYLIVIDLKEVMDGPSAWRLRRAIVRGAAAS